MYFQKSTISFFCFSQRVFGWSCFAGFLSNLFQVTFNMKPHLEYCIHFLGPQHQTQACWRGSRGGPWSWSEGWDTSPMKKSLVGVVQTGGAPGKPYHSLSVYLVSLWERWQILFTKACSHRARGSDFKLKEGIFILHTRKKYFTMRAVKLWNSLPRRVDATSLGVFKVRLDGLLSNLV